MDAPSELGDQRPRRARQRWRRAAAFATTWVLAHHLQRIWGNTTGKSVHFHSITTADLVVPISRATYLKIPLFCGNTFQIILFHVRAESSKSSKSLLKDRALVSRAGARKVCCNPRAKQARPAWKSGMAQRRDGTEALSPALEPWRWELNGIAGGLGGSRLSPSSKCRSWLQVQYVYIYIYTVLLLW